MQSQWSSVTGIVHLEIVHQCTVDLVLVQIYRTRFQRLTMLILQNVVRRSRDFRLEQNSQTYLYKEWIYRNLPDSRIRSRGTELSDSSATIWGLIIKGVRPDRRIRRRSYNTRIVHEAELLHHEKLAIPADSQKRNSQTYMREND